MKEQPVATLLSSIINRYRISVTTLKLGYEHFQMADAKVLLQPC